MKKPYEKPTLYAERFALVEHIATPCEGADILGKPTAGDYQSCSFQYKENDSFFPGQTVFITEDHGCSFITEDLSYYELTPTGIIGAS